MTRSVDLFLTGLLRCLSRSFKPNRWDWLIIVAHNHSAHQVTTWLACSDIDNRRPATIIFTAHIFAAFVEDKLLSYADLLTIMETRMYVAVPVNINFFLIGSSIAMRTPSSLRAKWIRFGANRIERIVSRKIAFSNIEDIIIMHINMPDELNLILATFKVHQSVCKHDFVMVLTNSLSQYRDLIECLGWKGKMNMQMVLVRHFNLSKSYSNKFKNICTSISTCKSIISRLNKLHLVVVVSIQLLLNICTHLKRISIILVFNGNSLCWFAFCNSVVFITSVFWYIKHSSFYIFLHKLSRFHVVTLRWKQFQTEAVNFRLSLSDRFVWLG